MNDLKKNIRVLLVEDSEDDALLVVRRLREGGFAVEHRRVDTRAALEEALREGPWDIILCDYSMPGFNGSDALRMVQDRGLDAPFIVISGNIGEDLAVAMMKAGAADYLLKDALAKLVPTVERELREAEVRQEKRRKDAALLRSETNLKKAEQIAKIGNWEWNILTNQLSWSDEVFRIYGLDPAKDVPSYEVVVRTVVPEQREQFVQAVESALQRDAPFEGEYRMIGLDGAERFTHTIGEVLRAADGRPLSMFGIVQDITRRKRVEESLRRAEALYHELVETAQDLIWQCDAEGRYTYLNSAWEAVLGYRVEEMLGRRFTEFQLPDAARRDADLFGELLVHGMVKGYETVHRSKDGRDVHLVFNAKRVLDDRGSVTGTRGTAYDITERKQAEAALAHSHDLMRYVIEHTRSAVAVHDRDLRYIYVSQRYLDEYQVKEKDVIGKHHYEVFPDLPQKWRDVHQRALAGEVLHAEDDPYEREDGTVDWTRWECRPWYEHDGTIGGIIVYTEVITERKQAEEALWQSRNMLNQVLNTMPQSVFWKDRDSVYLGCNAVFARAVGLGRPEDILGKTDFDLPWPRSEAEAYRADDREVMANNRPKHHIVEPLQQADGSRLWIDTSKVPLRDRDGKVFGMLGVFEDITTRKQAEDALVTRERQLAESQRIAHVGSWEHNPRTGEVAWSDELFRLLGLDPAKDRADFGTFFSRIHPEDQQALRAAVETTLREKKPFDIEYRFILPDQQVRTIHARADLVPDASGELSILRGTGQDITERKQAEEKLRQSEQFIRGILDTVDEGFIVVDRDYCILTANKAYCDQVGMVCNDVIGRHCYEISHSINRPCFEEKEDCAVRQVFASGEPTTVLHRHSDRDGHLLYVETKGFPIKDSAGDVVSVIETISNITERHLLEEERLKTQKLESIGTLAGGIAHDFNNLLQGVFGYISMARLCIAEKDRAVEMLDQAEQAVHQSVSLTSQLLTFSKGGKPVKQQVPLGPIIENATKFALSGSRSKYLLDLQPGLWNVDADSGQMGQVIQNIVLNADQAMAHGGSVVITARNLAADGKGLPHGLEPRDYVMIEVQDSGVGIPKQNIEKIFDPYFTTKEKGSGLGLATSYSIIKNHDGRIDVRSEAGKGSTFTIYVPASKEKPAETPERPVRTAPRRGRILVMDDEEVVRTVTGELIRALGHEADFAAHGDDAIAKYCAARDAGTPFDVVILDLTIRGGMGGLETVGRLRELDPQVRAVMSSGYSDEGVVADYRGHGFQAFLKKPYDFGELSKTLNAFLA